MPEPLHHFDPDDTLKRVEFVLDPSVKEALRERLQRARETSSQPTAQSFNGWRRLLFVRTDDSDNSDEEYDPMNNKSRLIPAFAGLILIVLAVALTLEVLTPGGLFAGGRPASIPAGSYTVTFKGADNIRVGCCLMIGESVLTFTDSGDFTVRAPAVVITGRYTVTGDQVSFDEGEPNYPCAEAVYVYRWEMADDMLIFSPVEDSCPERVKAMTAHPYVKEE